MTITRKDFAELRQLAAGSSGVGPVTLTALLDLVERMDAALAKADEALVCEVEEGLRRLHWCSYCDGNVDRDEAAAKAIRAARLPDGEGETT